MKPELETTILGMGAWQDADTNDRPPRSMTRLPTKGLDDAQIKLMVRALKKAGFDPIMRESSTLGPVITLMAVDAHNLIGARREFLTGQKWEIDKNGHEAQLATRGMDFDRMRAVHMVLESEHLHGESGMGRDNKGPVVSLSGKEADRLADFTQRAALGRFAQIEKYKEPAGQKLLRQFNQVAQRVKVAALDLMPKPAPKPYVHDPRNDVRINLPAYKAPKT